MKNKIFIVSVITLSIILALSFLSYNRDEFIEYLISDLNMEGLLDYRSNIQTSDKTLPKSKEGSVDGVPKGITKIESPNFIAKPLKNDPGYLVANTIANVLYIAAILAVIIIIYGGIRYIMSYGADDNIESAKKIILWAIIGLIITILSYFIVQNIIEYVYIQIK